ncbi:hypothetical protein [Reinekea marinisedimentorum]|uniref:Uncharacterized protein n=1 Tax=Reinekea marinisedimentorum TaxID=230495 RepID=A0A4R3IDC2_9GAMM|nr:hypothetical protein [Reinekea marinisedimentorum]TCS43727.1 hypothetical protein BCF53_10169 [Reinekea marinisedimentorum]
MKAIMNNGYAKAFIISLISILVCVGFYYVGFSDWSYSFRGQGSGMGMGMGKGAGGHAHEELPRTFINVSLPFLKAALMIGIPMTLGILIGKGYKRVKKSK